MDNKQNLMSGSREIGQNDNIRVKMDKFWSKKGQKLFFDSLLVVFLPVVIKYFLKPSGVPNVKKLVVFVKFMYKFCHKNRYLRSNPFLMKFEPFSEYLLLCQGDDKFSERFYCCRRWSY